MLTIHADVHATRRKRLHHILDEDSQALWSGQRFVDALDWLWENGHHNTKVDGGATVFILHIVKVPRLPANPDR